MEVKSRPHVKKLHDGQYAVMYDDHQIGPPLNKAIDVSIIVLWLAGGGFQALMDYHDILLTRAWKEYKKDG